MRVNNKNLKKKDTQNNIDIPDSNKTFQLIEAIHLLGALGEAKERDTYKLLNYYDRVQPVAINELPQDNYTLVPIKKRGLLNYITFPDYDTDEDNFSIDKISKSLAIEEERLRKAKENYLKNRHTGSTSIANYLWDTLPKNEKLVYSGEFTPWKYE